MPKFENRVALELAQGIKVFLKVEAGVEPRDGGAARRQRPTKAGRTGALLGKEALGRAGRRLAGEARRLLTASPQRDRGRVLPAGEPAGIRVENVVWIFGAGRTGSTWLSAMMGELEGHSVWFEPWVGALFDPQHLKLERRKGKSFVFSPHYKGTWLNSIRRLVLDGAEARHPGAASGPGSYLVIKEPGGSAGAPLLAEAMPESRMVLLVRDPRDYAASWLDAHKEGGWISREEDPEYAAQRVVRLANRYLQHAGGAKQAYDAHKGPKVLVRYEELRADTLGTMKRIYSALRIPVDEGQLAQAVEKHSWENIPEEEKGEGKFYRKATPGSWREDLTPEQAKTVERITAPLEQLYPSQRA